MGTRDVRLGSPSPTATTTRVVAASEHGMEEAGERGVSVQLAAQSIKAWARLKDRRQVEVALDRERSLLESLPRPSNPDHHSPHEVRRLRRLRSSGNWRDPAARCLQRDERGTGDLSRSPVAACPKGFARALASELNDVQALGVVEPNAASTATGSASSSVAIRRRVLPAM